MKKHLPKSWEQAPPQSRSSLSLKAVPLGAQWYSARFCAKDWMKPANLVLVLLLLLSTTGNCAFADQYYDAGLKSFQAKKYSDAVRYFEQSIKDAPWESASFYYCGLTYHYLRDFAKAKERYAQAIERFPGTEASTNAKAALNALDPNYMKTRAGAGGAAATTGAASKQPGSSDSGKSQDKGTVEGAEQARITYTQKGFDNVVDLRINGRSTKAIFDRDGEGTTFSRQQLAFLGINPEKGASEMKVELNLGGAIRKNFPVTVDDSGAPARVGAGFLDAYNVKVDETAHLIELKKKGTGNSNAGASSVAFTRDAKDILVSVDVNGHQVQMVYEAGGEGLSFTAKQAKAAGLRVDEAEEQVKSPNEGPVRGEAGWIPPEDRAAGPKTMSVRMKFGPIDKGGISCQIQDAGTGKYPKFGAGLVNSNGFQPEIDYKANKIYFTRK